MEEFVMEKMPAEKPSEEAMWAGPSGQRWLANAERFEETMRPIGEALITSAALRAGEKVIDVGCGAGAMSLEIARRVGSGGSVTGVDISPGLVGEATRRAAAAKLDGSARFVVADAARTSLPPGAADCLISRFGTMFFTDPYGAFVHLHGLLRAGGRLALAHWAPLKENPWMLEVRTILAAHFEMPIVPPRTPGPFAFEEPDYLRDILTKAQFAEIHTTPWQTQMFVGGPGSSPESAANFLMNALSMAQRALDAPEEVLNKVRKELRDRLQTYMTPEGVRMPASLWMTTARK
jgi:ubiquinone/menaquinone biosynthesis C-methylase UbiE